MDLLFPLLILFMIGMIFFSSRQRKKQQQEAESMQNSISVGDVVLMTSGISGTVVDTDDERTIDIEIAPDIITTWLRAAVREKLSSDADAITSDDEAMASDETEGVLEPADAPSETTGDGVTAGSTAPRESRSS